MIYDTTKILNIKFWFMRERERERERERAISYTKVRLIQTSEECKGKP